MTDIAIRVDNLSKLYHLGARQQRPDTLRDALTGAFARRRRNGPAPTDHRSPITDPGSPDDLWALKDVSFEACPAPPGCCAKVRRRIKHGEVVGSFSGRATHGRI